MSDAINFCISISRYLPQFQLLTLRTIEWIGPNLGVMVFLKYCQHFLYVDRELDNKFINILEKWRLEGEREREREKTEQRLNNTVYESLSMHTEF